MKSITFGDLVEAELHLQNLLNERDPNKELIIYPLTREGKLIKDVAPFRVNAAGTSKQVKRMLEARGVTSGNWYGADIDEELPSKYL